MDRTTMIRGLLDWFANNARDLPWRRTRDPYAIWVSEVMLQQTQVATVIPYWERWMNELPTVAALAKARPSRVHKLWEGLGYYTRARNLHRAAKVIVQEHHNSIPRELEKILELPGIGRYSAGAICSIAFNQPCPILDGNVIRVLTRVFGVEGNPREKKTNQRLWRLAEDLVRDAVVARTRPPPLDRLRAKEEASTGLNGKTGRQTQTTTTSFLAADFNQALMELGALTCTARQPRCAVCPCANYCRARIEDRINELPALGQRPTATHRRFIAFVVERHGRLLVRQRPDGVVNAFLWEFPNVEMRSEDGDLRKAAQRELGGTPVLTPFCSIKHSITRFRITLDVFRVTQSGSSRASQRSCRWLTCQQLKRLPFSSAHKKILMKLHTSRPSALVL